MSKAAELAALIGSQSALSNRNAIINGAFQCAQRGTSTTGSGFLVDRFELNINNTDNIAITQSQDSSGPSGFANSWKILATTAESAVAADERVRFRQNIEGQNLQQFAFGASAAKSMTLSFYVKSNKTGTYAVNLEQDDASRVIGGTYTISSADTWEFKTITVGGDASGTINDDNGVGLVVSWYLLAGSNYTATNNTSYGASADGKQAFGHSTTWGQGTNDNFFITGVQLEIGDVATPFEHRSFGDELAKCQRYFQRSGEYSTSSYPVNGQCYVYASTSVAGSFQLISSMRTSSPTVSFPNGNFGVRAGSAANNQYEFSSINSNQGATQGVMQFDATVPSGIQVNTIGVVVNAGNNRYMFVDAEL